MRICIIGILTATLRYILINKIGLDIKQTYDFFYLFISTGVFAGIINLIYEETYMLFSSGGGLPPIGGGNLGINPGGAGRGNPVATNPTVGQANPPAPAGNT
jgi:hypothetical protein